MQRYHKLLERQIRRQFSQQPISPELDKLFQTISNAYSDFEQDRDLMERAMDISSTELGEANRKAREEFEQKLIAQRIATEKEQILNSISDNVSEAIYRSTPDKGLIFVNRAFIELFRFASEEEALSTQSVDFYQNPEVRQKFMPKLSENKLLSGEEILFKRKDDTTFWGLMTTVLLTDKDGMSYYDGAIIDITEQKNNERELKEINKALTKTNKELDSFVYSIGHDLRAPIASTLGLVGLCKEETDIEKLKYYNELKEKSLQKLDIFIRDVLGYSRNARMELDLIRISVEEELKSIIALLDTAADSENVTVTIEVNPAGGQFLTDKYRFNLIFNNLISNAFRYHAKEKEGQYIHIKANISDDKAIITVKDNGQGIAPEHLPKVFNMFYRGHRTSTGSGLGLYIVKEAVVKLQGEISLESEFGKGSCFTVVLPFITGDSTTEE